MEVTLFLLRGVYPLLLRDLPRTLLQAVVFHILPLEILHTLTKDMCRIIHRAIQSTQAVRADLTMWEQILH